MSASPSRRHVQKQPSKGAYPMQDAGSPSRRRTVQDQQPSTGAFPMSPPAQPKQLRPTRINDQSSTEYSHSPQLTRKAPSQVNKGTMGTSLIGGDHAERPPRPRSHNTHKSSIHTCFGIDHAEAPTAPMPEKPPPPLKTVPIRHLSKGDTTASLVMRPDTTA